MPKAAREMVQRIEDAEAPPPTPAPEPPTRILTVDGETWTARAEGETIMGHGSHARAGLTAVRFVRGEGGRQAVRETYLPKGTFEILYDEELGELLRRARPVEPTKDDA